MLLVSVGTMVPLPNEVGCPIVGVLLIAGIPVGAEEDIGEEETVSLLIGDGSGVLVVLSGKKGGVSVVGVVGVADCACEATGEGAAVRLLVGALDAGSRELVLSSKDVGDPVVGVLVVFPLGAWDL